jgi:hypothetical protein
VAMSWPDDLLSGIFLFLFAFGLIFSIASLVFGLGDDIPGLEFGGGDHSGHAHGPFSLSALMVFLTWFGAAGYIARIWGGQAAWVALPVATAVGFAGGAAIWVLLAKILPRGESRLDPANYDLRGTVAEVTSSIREGGTGEIVYILDGKRRVDGARSEDGTPIPNGSEVLIVRYTAGIAYVAPLDWAEENVFLGQPVEPSTPPPP